MTSTDDLMSSITLPAIAAPMFLVSGPELVIACCRAGIIGTFPALNQRTSEGFAEWLVEIGEAFSALPNGRKPCFGVNLIVHRSNPRLARDLALCVEHKVPLVITSLGAAEEVVTTVHDYGGLVFHDVINRRHAEKAAAAGVDGLILVCAGAGGHTGSANPFAFISEVRSFFSGTILLSGGISTGAHIAAARAAGADLAYMGTRFIATRESLAPPAFKQLIVESGIQDIVYTSAVSGVGANFLRATLVKAGLDPDGSIDRNKINFDKDHEQKAWKDIWSAGHGVAAINDIPDVAELVETLKREYAEATRRFDFAAAS